MQLLNKKEIQRFDDIETENLKLDKKIAEYEKIIFNAKDRIDELEVKADKYIMIEQPDDQEKHLREMEEILKNPSFQYFIYDFREKMIKEASECTTPNEMMKAAGQLAAIDKMLGGMKIGHDALRVIDMEELADD